MKNGQIKNRINKNNQRGFTFIELAIVVTVIGVLASFAVPAYKDYTIRTKVAEVAGIFGPVKTAYSTHYSVNGRLPSNLGDLKTLTNNRRDLSGDYIQWMRVQSNGNVRARTHDSSSLGPAADKILEFRPVVANGSGGINWTVYSRENRNNWIPPKYLPSI